MNNALGSSDKGTCVYVNSIRGPGDEEGRFQVKITVEVDGVMVNPNTKAGAPATEDLTARLGVQDHNTVEAIETVERTYSAENLEEQNASLASRMSSRASRASSRSSSSLSSGSRRSDSASPEPKETREQSWGREKSHSRSSHFSLMDNADQTKEGSKESERKLSRRSVSSNSSAALRTASESTEQRHLAAGHAQYAEYSHDSAQIPNDSRKSSRSSSSSSGSSHSSKKSDKSVNDDERMDTDGKSSKSRSSSLASLDRDQAQKTDLDADELMRGAAYVAAEDAVAITKQRSHSPHSSRHSSSEFSSSSSSGSSCSRSGSFGSLQPLMAESASSGKGSNSQRSSVSTTETKNNRVNVVSRAAPNEITTVVTCVGAVPISPTAHTTTIAHLQQPQRSSSRLSSVTGSPSHRAMLSPYVAASSNHDSMGVVTDSRIHSRSIQVPEGASSKDLAHIAEALANNDILDPSKSGTWVQCQNVINAEAGYPVYRGDHNISATFGVTENNFLTAPTKSAEPLVTPTVHAGTAGDLPAHQLVASDGLPVQVVVDRYGPSVKTATSPVHSKKEPIDQHGTPTALNAPPQFDTPVFRKKKHSYRSGSRSATHRSSQCSQPVAPEWVCKVVSAYSDVKRTDINDMYQQDSRRGKQSRGREISRTHRNRMILTKPQKRSACCC